MTNAITKRRVLAASGQLMLHAFLLAPAAHAQGPAFLVKDINTVPSSSPPELTSFDGKIFFSVRDIDAGPGLWRSDGTAEGTTRITAARTFYVDFYDPTATDSALFFRAVLTEGGEELWSIDRTETAVRLKTVPPGFSFSELTAVRGTLFFVLFDDSGPELWKTDGTVAGTVPLTRFYYATSLTSLNGTLFFFAVSDDHGLELWKSDGTVAGTVRLRNFGYPVEPQEFTEVDGTLFFTGEASGGRGLWRSDGTVSGTAQIDTFSSLRDLTNVNGTLFFVADDGTAGEEIWKSDGTAAGTVRVTDFPAGCPLNCRAQGPSALTAANGTLFFTADVFFAGDDGAEFARAGLWRSDGTAAGTRLLRGPFVAPSALATIDGTLYFVAEDASTGFELWRSDGTEAGTVRVKDIHPGPASTAFSFLTDVDGTLFFWADDGNGWAIWKSDGTEVGTVRVADILHDTFGSNPTQLTGVNGTLLFVADDGHSGAELWRSDGTAPGTRLVKDINPAAGAFDPFNPHQSAEIGGTLFFAANDGTSGVELWRSDGTESGTVLVKDINPGAGDSYLSLLTDVNGTLFFSASDGSHGSELWKSDGTETGTVLVSDINPGSGASIMRHCGFFWCELEVEPTAVNDTLFFFADDGSTGRELWKSDGTAAGTVQVADIEGRGGLNPTLLTSVDGTVFFGAWGDDGRPGLWRTDGTAAGTLRLGDFPTLVPGSEYSESSTVPYAGANGILFFIPYNSQALWRSDGTVAGTVRVRDLGSFVSPLTSLADAVFWVEYENGATLWRSDGTAAGTRPVKELGPRFPSSALANINGTLLFSVGGEIWRSDGTEAGTRRIQGFGSLYPESPLTLAGGHVFFSAWVGGGGAELWALPLATSCRGDCGGDGVVTINDLITAVNIALNGAPLTGCQSLDANDDGSVTIDEIIAVVNEALYACV